MLREIEIECMFPIREASCFTAMLRAVAALSCAGIAAAGMPVLGGYDMVAYFSLPNTAPSSHGVLGSQAHSVNISTVDVAGTAKSLGSYEFWFSSAANAAKFAADPWKFAPKYGGF